MPGANKEAAGVAQTPAAANLPDDTAAIFREDADRFKRMQLRVGRAGYVLRQLASGGYMALKDCTSFHTDSLDAMHGYLTQRGATH